MTRPVGRPSKLNDATKRRLEQALVAGNTIEDACVYADINRSTYFNWIIRAENDRKRGRNTEYVDFLDTCQRAKERAKPRLVMLLAAGAEKDPRLALTILERRYNDEWGVKSELSFRDKTGEPIPQTDMDRAKSFLALLDKHPSIKAELIKEWDLEDDGKNKEESGEEIEEQTEASDEA